MFDRSKPVTTMLAGFGLASLLTVGCVATQRTVNLAALAPPYRVQKASRWAINGGYEIVAGSKDEQVIKQWLQVHETGWRTDFNSYDYSRRIKGDRFNLIIAGRVCVLNYDPTGKGDWVQVSRKIDENDPLPELFTRDR